jgi:signal transduction histidine kinase
MQFDRDKYEQQGSGLGLAIIKSITEMYRSEFAIESLPEESTTVKIIFPYSTS